MSRVARASGWTKLRLGMKEIWAFLRVRKKWWLVPILLAFILLALLILTGEGTALGPFIYTLF